MNQKPKLALLVSVMMFVSTGVGPCQFFIGQTAVALRALAYNRANGVGVAAGDEGAIYTTTGLLPWQLVTSGTTQRLNAVGSPLFGLLNPLTNVALFYVVGNAGTILRSTNNGVDWSSLSSGTIRNLNGVSVVNLAQTFVVGDSGLIIKTTNGGSSWSTLISGTSRSLRCIHAITSDIVIAAGDSGTILRTDNGGTTWSPRLSDPTTTFNRVTSAIGTGGVVLWIVGDGGAIYTSSTYGLTWTPQSSSTTHDLNDAVFKDGTTGVVVGNAGTVRHTTNGGITWLADTYLNSLTAENIEGIAPVQTSASNRGGVDTLTVVGIVGNGIMTISTEPLTGVPGSNPLFPSDFALYQNYPNPFNPATNFRYHLPAGGIVTLSVHDISGRGVATIVHEYQPAGWYEKRFDASELSTGVYLARLSLGTVVDVKKMILIK